MDADVTRLARLVVSGDFQAALLLLDRLYEVNDPREVSLKDEIGRAISDIEAGDDPAVVAEALSAEVKSLFWRELHAERAGDVLRMLSEARARTPVLPPGQTTNPSARGMRGASPSNLANAELRRLAEVRAEMEALRKIGK